MKYRIAILSFFFIIGLSPLQSQDYISIKNEEEIKVNILEIGSVYMVYNMWKQDGITYRVNRAEITSVTFDDSREVIFKESYPAFTNSNFILKSIENGNYLVGEEWIEDFWALGSEFSKNSKSAKYFYKAKKQHSRAKTLGTISLVAIGGGMLLLGTADDYYDAAFVAGVFSVVTLGPITGTIGVVAKLNSINNKRKAEESHGVRYVNQSLKSPNTDLATINLGLSQNGVGLIVQF